MKPLLLACALLLCGCTTHRGNDAFPGIVAALRPSVVLLTMRVPNQDNGSTDKFQDAYASGVVVSSGPWGSDVLTVEHAIEGASNLHATIGGIKHERASVAGRDRALDIAVVHLRRGNLPSAKLGTSADLLPGEAIGIIGYPIPDAFEEEGLGTTSSIYAGRISSLRRHAIELNLPIVPGESGGPVFRAENGEVVGIAESRFEEERSIGFALPIDDAKRFLRVHARHCNC
ncbi:MAG: serine protease [Candidatus Eremiobacteraeota bacterium]|nr:serine protease [Candidatus Eremiobacteraeota bacterium]